MAESTLTILDVGHGNSAVIRGDDNVVIIDAGRKSFLLEYLKTNGIEHVDAILISHADQDHIGGLLALLSCEEITINRVRLNTDSFKTSKEWDDLIYELYEQDKNKEIDFQVSLVAGSGEELSCGDLNIEVLGPNKYLAGKGPGSKDNNKKTITSNSISAVIKLTRAGESIALLPGDLDQVGLESILSDENDLRSRILVYPHHGGGSGNNLTEEFAEKLVNLVSPTDIIFSIGRGRYNTPRPEIIRKIKQINSDIRVVCTQLSKNCAEGLPDSAPDYLGRVYSQGAEKGLSCGGSILVSIDDGSIPLPCKSEHDSYILGNVPNALCKL